ncbi:MAG: LysR substrate-binding domain-containing protein [Rhizobiaceae bacterium]
MYTLDTDQLKTFLAVEQTLSFTKAADMVARTQSAVSMQIKKLEETLGKQLFFRMGRSIKLTGDGHKLVPYAREIVDASNRALAAFDDQALSGSVYLGTADDYAERFLPSILAGFSQSNPFVEVSVTCENSGDLQKRIRSGELDVAIVTHSDTRENSELIRCEPLLWVGSQRYNIQSLSPIPLALGGPNCVWRMAAISALEQANLDHKLMYTSFSATVVGAAVLAGLAVSVLPESALRPGMQVLGERDGFPPLPQCEIGLIRSRRESTEATEALVNHIKRSLDTLPVMAASIDDPLAVRETVGLEQSAVVTGAELGGSNTPGDRRTTAM